MSHEESLSTWPVSMMCNLLPERVAGVDFRKDLGNQLKKTKARQQRKSMVNESK